MTLALSPLAARSEWIKNYRLAARVGEQGRVVSVGDGIVWIDGLPSAAIDEVLRLEDGSRAMVFHLTELLVGAILLEQTEQLTAGTLARHSGLSSPSPWVMRFCREWWTRWGFRWMAVRYR